MATFSERLKLLRARAGMTQPELAEKLNISKGAVGNWESGMHIPSRKTLRQIAGLLATTETFLTGDSDIDSGAFIEPTTEYSGALPFSRMNPKELDFIFSSRQKELSETTDPQKRRELLGLISEVAAEMQKRIPQEIETEMTRRGIADGDNREVRPEEKKK
jgi:transcriptional regulator with XRE-family HTH domain